MKAIVHFSEKYLSDHPEKRLELSGKRVAFLEPVGPILISDIDSDFITFYEELKNICKKQNYQFADVLIESFLNSDSAPVPTNFPE